jgi:hypothetical protein
VGSEEGRAQSEGRTVPRQLKPAGWATVKVATSDLAQLALANILNNGKCITGREGLSEGFVEPVIRKLPFPYLAFTVSWNGFSLILGQTLYNWPVVPDIHRCFLYSDLSADQKNSIGPLHPSMS